MVDIRALIGVNAHRWSVMHLKADRLADFNRTAVRLCIPDHKTRFAAVTERLVSLQLQPVPWWFIAIVSEREYGPDQHGKQRWDRQLGQGDPLDQVSHNEPKGRGPFLHHD